MQEDTPVVSVASEVGSGNSRQGVFSNSTGRCEGSPLRTFPRCHNSPLQEAEFMPSPSNIAHAIRQLAAI